MPAGYYHQAICTDHISAHLSFSSVEMIGLDVISELFDNGVLDEFFRGPIQRTNGGTLSIPDYLKLLTENIALFHDKIHRYRAFGLFMHSQIA